MRLSNLPLMIFLLPAVAANLAWALSTHLGLVPPCNVYLEGCISISAAGREPPVVFLFRGAIIPLAVLLAVFWRLACIWLRVLGERSRARLAVIELVGSIGALFLILYALFLGTEGEAYRLLRRYGVTVFFAFTYLAALLVTGAIRRAGEALLPRWLANTMVGVCAAMLLGGLASLPAAEWAMDRSAVNNIIEWNLSGVLMSWFLLAWLAWWRTGFRADFTARPGG